MLHRSVRLWQVRHTLDLTKLFIQIIHCHPHFVKLVIIRALRIELFLLKCRQIWIFSNIILNSFLHQISAQHINPEITYIGGRSQRTNNTNCKKLMSAIYCIFHWFILVWLLYKFVSSAVLASISSVKKIYFKNWWEVQIFKIFSDIFIFSLNLKTVFIDCPPPLPIHFHLLENGFPDFPNVFSAL